MTLLGIDVFLQPKIMVLVEDRIIALQLSRLSYLVFPSSTIIEDKPGQLPKALLPILVTLAGIVIDVSPVQPLNASLPILVTLLGIVIDVRPVQPLNAFTNGCRNSHYFTSEFERLYLTAEVISITIFGIPNN